MMEPKEFISRLIVYWIFILAIGAIIEAFKKLEFTNLTIALMIAALMAGFSYFSKI